MLQVTLQKKTRESEAKKETLLVQLILFSKPTKEKSEYGSSYNPKEFGPILCLEARTVGPNVDWLFASIKPGGKYGDRNSGRFEESDYGM